MFYISGLLIALLSLASAIFYLGQNASHYFDFVAFCMVIGGTSAVAVIIFPWEYHRDILKAFKDLFGAKKLSKKQVLLECINFAQAKARNDYNYSITLTGLPGRILKDGEELIDLEMTSDKIEAILKERVFQAGQRAKRVANTFRALAKYPPAFGLAGTVLGLVSVMKDISAGTELSHTGTRMAVALVATFYGLLMANLVVNPAGENVLKLAQEDEKVAEIALQAVVMAAEKSSILETQEMLNSFVTERERLNILGSYVETMDKAA